LIYAFRILWPLGYSARYWVDRHSSFSAPEPLAGAGLLLLLAAGLCLALRGGRRRTVLLLAGWPLACMLPVLNLVPIPIVVAERYLYLALAGPCLAAAYWWTNACRSARYPWARQLLWTAGGAAVVALGFLSYGRCGVFRDTETLWRSSLEAQPENPVVRLFLARELLSRDGTDQLAECLELLDVSSRATGQLTGENQNYRVARAQVLGRLGRQEAADEELRRASDLARRQGWRRSTAVARARRLAARQRFGDAHAALEAWQPRARSEERQLEAAHAEICLTAGDDRGYLHWNGRLLARDPFNVILWHNREQAARRLGMESEAARAARRCEELLGN
jgi:hypothetical protein